MEKSFEFPVGTLIITKTEHKGKPALRLSMDSVSIHIDYNFETIRDRAYIAFDSRNALAVYSGMLNMVEEL